MLQSIRIILFVILSSAYIYPPLSMADTNQTTAQEQAEAVTRKGSDLSMQNSTSNAMTALMDLASLNVSGAVQHGTQAYGQFRNSEHLDDNADVSAYLRHQMGSGSSNASGADKFVPSPSTSYSRLDPSFLYSGNAASVAEEFEKRTGMKRDEFLHHLSTATDHKISPNDPQLVDKVISRFEQFVTKIPNKDFRSNLEKGIQLIPQTARTGLIAQAVQKFASYMADSDPELSKQIMEAKNSISKEQKEKTNEASTQAVAKEEDTKKIDPSAKRAPAQSDAKPIFALESEKIDLNDSLGGAIQAALEAQGTQDEQTIFQQISKRYKLIAPHFALKLEQGTAK